LNPIDKLFWVLARRFWSEWKESLMLVLSDTVVRWHRAGFRLYWTMLCRVRKKVGRGRRISKEIRDLIFQMVAENPGWGASRIHVELLMLGYDVSETTISRCMWRAPRRPEPAQRWLAFLRNHRDTIACAAQKFIGPYSVETKMQSRGLSEILVRQEPAVVVGLQPVLEVNLVQIRRHRFGSQVFVLSANEGNIHSGKDRNQRLKNAVWVDRAESIPRLHPTQPGGKHQQPMSIAAHQLQPLDENSALHRERVNKVRQVLPLHHASVFHTGNRVVAQFQGLFLHPGEPALKT
jgi:hypothetical protein